MPAFSGFSVRSALKKDLAFSVSSTAAFRGINSERLEFSRLPGAKGDVALNVLVDEEYGRLERLDLIVFWRRRIESLLHTRY